MNIPTTHFCEPLLEDVSADVCVIGAGISGLSCAYFLALSGKRVVVLDDGPIGGGETERTTAHLSAALDDRFYKLEQMHGRHIAALAAESHMQAIDKIEQVIADHGIVCDFRRLPGYLFLDPTTDRKELERELDAAKRAGLPVEMLASTPGVNAGACLRFANMGQMHPMKYMVGLAKEICSRKGRIYSPVRATSITPGSKSVFVKTNRGGLIDCGAVIVATNSPFNDRVTIHTKQAAYRSYAIAAEMEVKDAPDGLFWDTADPYHYVRTQELEDGKVALIVGGEDHKTGQMRADKDYFGSLEHWMRVAFPLSKRVTHRWSGQVMEPVDGLGFIGPNPADDPRIFIATGDSGHGITHGTIAGMMLSHWLDHGTHRFAPAYDPARVTLAAAGQYAKDAANTVGQYLNWMKPGDVAQVEQIPLDSGAVVRRGLSLVAVYRDGSGQTHACSAVCTHLGGIVAWNDAEKSWDCPCHGSRFSALGELLNGPANTSLNPATNDENTGEGQPIFADDAPWLARTRRE